MCTDGEEGGPSEPSTPTLSYPHKRSAYCIFFDFCPENNKVSSVWHLGLQLRRKLRGSVVPHSRSLSSIYISRCGADQGLPDAYPRRHSHSTSTSHDCRCRCSFSALTPAGDRAIRRLEDGGDAGTSLPDFEARSEHRNATGERGARYPMRAW
jgi:hypothetical protein